MKCKIDRLMCRQSGCFCPPISLLNFESWFVIEKCRFIELNIWRYVRNLTDQRMQNKLIFGDFGMFLRIITSILATVMRVISD